MKFNVLVLLLFLITGCATSTKVSPVVIVSPQKALLSPCKVIPVGELGVDYESAFYAVSDAYIDTAESVAKCNARLKAANKQIEELESQHDNSKK